MVKIVSRISTILIASSFALSVNVRLAQANPAVLAPAALCSTGVGCVLVGAVVIAGATYYLWEYGGGKRVLSDRGGRVLKSDYYSPDVFDNQIEIAPGEINTREKCHDYALSQDATPVWMNGQCFIKRRH